MFLPSSSFFSSLFFFRRSSCSYSQNQTFNNWNNQFPCSVTLDHHNREELGGPEYGTVFKSERYDRHSRLRNQLRFDRIWQRSRSNPGLRCCDLPPCERCLQKSHHVNWCSTNMNDAKRAPLGNRVSFASNNPTCLALSIKLRLSVNTNETSFAHSSKGSLRPTGRGWRFHLYFGVLDSLVRRTINGLGPKLFR